MQPVIHKISRNQVNIEAAFLQGTLAYNALPNLFFLLFFISQVNFENTHILSETCSVQRKFFFLKTPPLPVSFHNQDDIGNIKNNVQTMLSTHIHTLICLFWCRLCIIHPLMHHDQPGSNQKCAEIRSHKANPEGRILKIATPFGRVFFFFLEILTYFTLSMEQLKIGLHNLVGDFQCKRAFI